MQTRTQMYTESAAIELEEDCRAAQAVTFTAVWNDELENDCKATYLLKPALVLEKQVFIRAVDALEQPLPNGYWLVYSPYAPTGPSVLNPAAWQRWQSFQQPQPLSQPVDLSLARQMLLFPEGMIPEPLPGKPETLTAWMHVTNACNLDCPYCYIRKSSARMSEEIGELAISQLFQTAVRHGFRGVKIKYAGGEASLHFQLIRRLHEQAVRLARQNGLALREVLLTNGVQLRPADADWLAAGRLKVMVSMDGVDEWHDRLRRQKNGRTTFKKVAHTVDHILLPRGIRPTIAMTVTGLNAGGAAGLAEWALVERGLPLSINFYRPNLLSAQREELVIEEKAIIDGMLAAYAVIEKWLPDRPFLDGLLDRVQTQAHAHTCGAGQNYIVIGHNGQLAQCQMHLDQPAGQLSIGASDLLPIVSQGAIQNLSVQSRGSCQSCEIRYRCSGGCPIETFRATGRWDVQSPNCSIYKTLYPAALRLEGLRLMKINNLLD